MTTLMVTIRAGGDEESVLTGILEGIPAGTVIPKGYLSHQLWRIRRCMDPTARTRTGADIVGIISGMQRRTTTGSPLELRIQARSLGGRSTRPMDPDLGLTLRGLAVPFSCLTIVRKILEDRSIFVGSRVLATATRERDASPSIKEPRIARMLMASCGAYKITEAADRSPGRVIRFRAGVPLRGSSTESPRIFELLVSGPFGWVAPELVDPSPLASSLAAGILGNGLVTSVSADVSEMKRTGVTVVRLRSVVGGKGPSRRVSAARAALLSVLSETVVIPDLAHRVAGLSLEGLPALARKGSHA